MGGFGVRARINATLRDLRLFTAAEAQYNKHPSAPPRPDILLQEEGKKSVLLNMPTTGGRGENMSQTKSETF